MPQTVPFGFEVEALDEEPTRTLNGGSDGLSPRLGDQVNDALVGLVSDIGGLDARLAALESFGLNGSEAQTIATIDSGQNTNTTEFAAIPQDYRDLVIHWTGVSDSPSPAEIDSLALRFNGDDTDEYFSRLSRNEAAGTYTSSAGTFSVMRAGHVGTNSNRRSGGTVWIPDYSRDGVTKTVHGISISRGQGLEDNIFTTEAGGTWTGTSAINHIRIWVSGALWEVIPHITLIGFR